MFLKLLGPDFHAFRVNTRDSDSKEIKCTLTPPGGYLYPFHIVPAMRTIHKTTIIVGLLGCCGRGAVTGRPGSIRRILGLLSGFIPDQMVSGPAWQFLTGELCGLD